MRKIEYILSIPYYDNGNDDDRYTVFKYNHGKSFHYTDIAFMSSDKNKFKIWLDLNNLMFNGIYHYPDNNDDRGLHYGFKEFKLVFRKLSKKYEKRIRSKKAV